MVFTLPELPYPVEALDPHISARTVSIHYGKHHRTYMEKLKKAIEDTPQSARSLEELVVTTEGSVFNNAAQVWNHTFYWNSMKPGGGGKPGGELLVRIERAFGSLADFKQRFAEAAAVHFGSGWTWLAADDAGMLRILGTHDAGNPLQHGLRPLLTIDVWEHAYYLDYQNQRPRYIETFMDNLINWEFAQKNLV
jgi:Fe-Mn family superoxide dismutase